MSNIFRSIQGISTPGGDRIYLWLILGLLILMTVTGSLAILITISAAQSDALIAALRSPTPVAARPSPPATAQATPPVTGTPSTPVPPTPTPLPGTVWYFADNGSIAPSRTRFVLANPADKPLQVSITLFTGPLEPKTITVTVNGRSHLTLSGDRLGTNPNLPVAFQGQQPFYVERVVAFGSDAHSLTGAQPATTWYVPLMETRQGYDTWLYLANFNPVPAQATVTFLAEGGVSQAISRTIPAMAQLALLASRELSPTGSIRPGSRLGAVVWSNQPIVLEEATYFNQGDGGYALPGSPVLARVWYLPEGNTRPDFDTTLAILNPGTAPTTLTVTYLPEGRSKATKTYTVGPASPFYINLKAELPGAAIATIIQADKPVVAGRVMFFNQGRAAHATLGAVATAKEWLVPAASTSSPDVPVLVVLNPGTQAAEVTVSLLPAAGQPAERRFSLAEATRFALLLEQIAPDAHLAAWVRATQPVVVERVTYFRNARGGMASSGIPVWR